MIGELFTMYQSGAKRTCLILVILRQLHAVTPRRAVFHTIPMPTVCDSVSWIVEVGKGYQSVHIYVGANRGSTDIICIMYAKSIDCANNYPARSMDSCAK